MTRVSLCLWLYTVECGVVICYPALALAKVIQESYQSLLILLTN